MSKPICSVEDLEEFLEEDELFCFSCGTNFSFVNGCKCRGDFAIKNWVLYPTKLDITLFFRKNTCLISSYDGSCGLPE